MKYIMAIGIRKNIIEIRDKLKNLREYKGIIIYADGSILEGHFAKNNPTRKCRKLLSNLCIQEGNYENGLLNGKGIEISPDGTTYEGNFVGGLKEGIGKCKYADGSEYEGYFANGKPHGRGKLILLNGEKYEGEWKQGFKHGKGILRQSNGDRYEGCFEDGTKNGFGKYFSYI